MAIDNSRCDVLRVGELAVSVSLIACCVVLVYN